MVNPRLNALVTLDAEGAARAAEESGARWRTGRPLGPLDGVPVTIKDNLHVRGLPTRWGSRALAGLVAERDELPVARLRDGGAVIFGKTNVPEFTMQGYTDNPVFGPTGNPWNPALTPGGSSGGAVALVAAGCCPLALGTDGGGSIRRPARIPTWSATSPRADAFRAPTGCRRSFWTTRWWGRWRAVSTTWSRCCRCSASPMRATPVRPPFAARPVDVAQAPARPCRMLYIPRFARSPGRPRASPR